MGMQANCQLCGKAFESDDARIVVYCEDKRYEAHRPCIGEAVHDAALALESVQESDGKRKPKDKRAFLMKKLVFATRIAAETAKKLSEMATHPGSVGLGRSGE